MRLGIDLGGTKIELLALDDDGRECFRKRVPTPSGDYTATLSALAELIHEADLALGVEGSIGIGIPGAESLRDGRIKNANSTCLIGQPLRQDLYTRLGRPVRLANDANCFALSEAIDGSAAGAQVVFGVILGTGVGGGIVINGQPLAGANAIAGEWGHNPLPDPYGDTEPPACYCGRQGCIETYLSGPGLARDHARLWQETLNGEEIARRAEAGDARALQTLERYARRLARALAGVINLLDPDAIVLGGGLSRLAFLYDVLPALCAPHVFSDTLRTPILPPRHGDSSGVRGAAWLWPLASQLAPGAPP